MKTKITELKKVVAYLKTQNLADIELKFACYVDHTFVFNYEVDNQHFEVSIICSSMSTVMDKMLMSDLFNLTGIQYFEFRNYIGKKIVITFNINENVN